METPKIGFGGPWVGAFSVFPPDHTGTPFIFWPKSPFFAKIGRFRGWCNTTPSTVWTEGCWGRRVSGSTLCYSDWKTGPGWWCCSVG